MSYQSDEYAYYDDYYSSSSFFEELSEESSQPEEISDVNIPQPVVCDPSIVFCENIEQSKKLLEQQMGTSINRSKLRNVTGLLILPLKDINLIRKDGRHLRELPNILVVPSSDDFIQLHSELATCIQMIHKNQ